MQKYIKCLFTTDHYLTFFIKGAALQQNSEPPELVKLHSSSYKENVSRTFNGAVVSRKFDEEKISGSMDCD